MKVQRARIRIIALVLLCAFGLVLLLSFRMLGSLPESDDPSVSVAGNPVSGEEYDEHTVLEEPSHEAEPAGVDAPVATVPPAESMDIYGL